MYDELVKRLRRYSENVVAYKLDADFASAIQEAADAIEELQKRVPKAPHGRLGDLDALCNRLEKAGKIKPYLESGLNAAISFALSAPTIIEAEPAEEGE